MRTGNVSPGPTSRLVTVTEPFPPGVTSCAVTSMVIPRIRRCVALRSVSAVCRSSSIAPPRAVSLESPGSEEITATGESFGRSILGSTPANALPRNNTGRKASAAKLLLCIVHLVRRHLTGVGVYVTYAGRTLHADGYRDPVRAWMH